MTARPHPPRRSTGRRKQPAAFPVDAISMAVMAFEIAVLISVLIVMATS